MRDIVAAMAALIVTLLGILGVANWVADSFSHSKLSDVESNLIMMQVKTQHLFSGSSSYNELTNDLVLSNGIIPPTLVKGDTLTNPWGGTIIFAPENSGSAFSIQFTSIPQSECTKLALFQPDAWLSVVANSTPITNGEVGAATSACASTENTITFTTR